MVAYYELCHLGKHYEGRAVFDDFNLAIAQGDMVAITGPSGAGKSTILNILGLIDSPDQGQITILGCPAPKPHSMAATRQMRKHIGYLFQNFALIDDMNVKKNLEVALTYAPRSVSKKKLIANALDQVGLSGMEERDVYSLSGGEQQRVALARLLLKPCDVILADEPTGSLDPDNRDIVLGLLHDINQSGKTVVISTHDPAVVDVCNREIPLRPA